MKVKLNDKVLVISGKNKGKSGHLIRIITKRHQVVVEKVNLKTKHTKKSQSGPGEKIHFEAPIDVSNVVILCPACNKPTRAGYKITTNGKKERICKKCNATLDRQISETAKKAGKEVVKV